MYPRAAFIFAISASARPPVLGLAIATSARVWAAAPLPPRPPAPVDRRRQSAARSGPRPRRLHRGVVEREVLAGERHVIAAPQRATDRERLEKAPDATLPRHAGGGEFLADRRRVGGDADAEDDAALGDAVERADDVRKHDGIAQRRQ